MNSAAVVVRVDLSKGFEKGDGGAEMDLSLLTQAIPLTAMVCLAYSATRYELREKILKSAMVMFLKTLGFLGGVYVFLLWIST
jgi:hypothetical protein